jgi:hypothetical protein
MVETLLARDLPETLSGTYEAQGVWNRVDNRFVETGPESTRWIFESEFRCTGM